METGAAGRVARGQSRIMSDGAADLFPQLSVYAELRQLLIHMEADLGLANLNRVERDLYHACTAICSEDGSFESSELRAHRLMQTVASATYHRALKKLLDLGYIRRAPSSVVKNYVLIVR